MTSQPVGSVWLVPQMDNVGNMYKMSFQMKIVERVNQPFSVFNGLCFYVLTFTHYGKCSACGSPEALLHLLYLSFVELKFISFHFIYIAWTIGRYLLKILIYVRMSDFFGNFWFQLLQNNNKKINKILYWIHNSFFFSPFSNERVTVEKNKL